METSTKWMILAASVFLTVGLITFAYFMTNTAQEKGREANNEMVSVFQDMSDSKYMVYNGGTSTGSQVINAIRQYAKKPQFGIKVITGKGDVSFYGNTFQDDGTVSTAAKIQDYSKAEDPTSPAYVNLSGNFEPKLVRDGNSVIRGIIFKQQ